jgi:hypothetical protein
VGRVSFGSVWRTQQGAISDVSCFCTYSWVSAILHRARKNTTRAPAHPCALRSCPIMKPNLNVLRVNCLYRLSASQRCLRHPKSIPESMERSYMRATACCESQRRDRGVDYIRVKPKVKRMTRPDSASDSLPQRLRETGATRSHKCGL